MKEYEELASELKERLRRLNNNKKQLWIGIAGGPGSGKSTLATELQERLQQLVIVIPMDGYHYYRNELDEMDDPTEAYIRRGSAFTFNSTKFIDDLIEAKRLAEGAFPSFDHRIGDPIEKDIQLLKTHRVVLVEGNYLLLNSAPWKRLKTEVFDESWYLDVSLEECKRRLLKRHMMVGLTKKQALQRIATNDGMNAELIAKESPDNADRMIRISSISIV